jgi:GNAT superfamily N-acetyltransferase
MEISDEAVPGIRELRRGTELIGRYRPFDAQPPVAELFEPAVDVGTAVEVILTELAGWSLTTTDEALAEALVGEGARAIRHFALMSCDLTTAELSDDGDDRLASLDVRPFSSGDSVPAGVIELVRAAYPPGHPDVELGSDDDIVRDIEHAQSGGRMGPMLDASRLVFDRDRLVALVLINRVPGVPPLGGPWVTDICRDPDPAYSGLGRALLTRTLRTCRDGGEQAISLAVTEGNSARWLYESLGFSVVITTRKVRIPD